MQPRALRPTMWASLAQFAMIEVVIAENSILFTSALQSNRPGRQVH
jgi:hypothetical protein